MGKYDTFHKTKRGYLHIQKEIPCEDDSASCTYEDDQGQFYFAAVADGHGDTSCMRSAQGSRLAVQAAQRCLEEYARNTEGRSIPELAGQIVACWVDWVRQDLADNCLSEEELKRAGVFEPLYRNGERLEHIYGTTLIAALMLPDSLILLQQGDGRCEVFYEDGTVDQPIPWDERCQGNITTSMCDEDARERIRFQVLDLTQRKVIACCLGSDGVEDSFRNMEGVHMFYRKLLCRFCEQGRNEFEAFLDEMLPSFSRKGSGDDVSVGVIVDSEGISQYIPAFQKVIRRYGLKEELARYESRKISMSRKHGILKRRWEEAGNDLTEVGKSLESEKTARDQTKLSLDYASDQYEDAENKRWDFEKELERQKREQKKLIDEALLPRLVFLQQMGTPPMRAEISNTRLNLKLQKQECERLERRKADLKNDLLQQSKNIKLLLEEKETIKARYEDAKKKFEEYDAEYQKIQTAIDRLSDELYNLS